MDHKVTKMFSEEVFLIFFFLQTISHPNTRQGTHEVTVQKYCERQTNYFVLTVENAQSFFNLPI